MRQQRPARPPQRNRKTRALAVLVLGGAFLASGCGTSAPSLHPTPSSSPAASVAASAAAIPSADESVTPSRNPSTPPAAVVRLGALPESALDAGRSKALQAALDQMVASGARDAIAAVITEDGTWAGAAGIAGAKGRKATGEDEFAIASITKTFTAALILGLVEQGKMDLDEPLASYMGDLKADTNGATVRQALEMRAGLADFPQPAAAEHIRKDSAHVWTAEEMIAEADPPIAAAGEKYLYSSAGYD